MMAKFYLVALIRETNLNCNNENFKHDMAFFSPIHLNHILSYFIKCWMYQIYLAVRLIR